MTQLQTYSGRDLNGALSSLLFGSISLAGINSQGIEKVMVRMTTDHAVTKTGMDGAVVPSYVPGESGEVEIQVWQTSTIHQEFLAAYNTIQAAAALGDVSQAFGATLFLSNVTDGSSHTCTGGSFSKVPDKTYEADAQVVSWLIRFCNVISE